MRVGARLGHLADAVLVAQQMQHLGIEHLPGGLRRLLEDGAAVLGIGVVAEIGALIDEAAAGGVDDDAEGIGMLLEIVADGEVAEFGRVAVPGHGMAARPIAARHGADLERHADAVAGVEARAAHLGEVPAGAEIARAPFGIGLEAARGQHHRLGGDVEAALAVADMDADDAALVEQQVQHAGAVMDGDAVAPRGL